MKKKLQMKKIWFKIILNKYRNKITQHQINWRKIQKEIIDLNNPMTYLKNTCNNYKLKMKIIDLNLKFKRLKI